MSRVLLLDLDHTLYPSTLPTQYVVDARITEYIQKHLGLSPKEADILRQELCARYGTTLKGLETLYGVDREYYCDFIQNIEDASMPTPDPELRKWLIATGQKIPTYLFTNARRDWADRCLASVGISDLLAESAILRGILDIHFLEWSGKPQAEAFRKIERHMRERHGEVQFIFADDRLDNLDQARLHGWLTIWVRPHDAFPRTPNGGNDVAPIGGSGKSHHIIDSLIELDIDSLP